MPEFRLKNEYVVQVLPGLALERLKHIHRIGRSKFVLVILQRHIHRIGRCNITRTNFVLTNCLFTKNKHRFSNDRKKKTFLQILQKLYKKYYQYL